MFTTISKVFSKLYFWTCGGAGSRKSGDRGDFNPSSGDNKWGIRGERLCLCVRHVCPVCLCLLPVFLLTCLTITPVSIHPDKRPTRPSRLGQTVQSVDFCDDQPSLVSTSWIIHHHQHLLLIIDPQAPLSSMNLFTDSRLLALEHCCHNYKNNTQGV